MDSGQMLYLLLTSFFRQLPEFIVVLVGIIICFINLKKYPKPSKMALGGLFILLIAAFLGLLTATFFTYLPLWYGYSYQAMSYITFAVGIILSIFRAAGLGLLIFAVWAARENKSLTA